MQPRSAASVLILSPKKGASGGEGSKVVHDPENEYQRRNIYDGCYAEYNRVGGQGIQKLQQWQDQHLSEAAESM